MHVYAAIDLKSFYASVECQERGLDPITTNLVVADKSRTNKTVCLAVTPSLKQYGISGRARLYQVEQRVKEINIERKFKAPYKTFTGSSYDDIALRKNPDLELSFIIAPPRMSYYMKYSTEIVKIYLKYFSIDDMFVYSIDEVFIDLTHYLRTYKMRAKELVTKVIHDVYKQTGITATAGIGTNLYLAKIAMDIVAKHAEPDQNGVRLAGLDEKTYRKLLWEHTPITDFWRVGSGYAKKLEKYGIRTMGDVADMSIRNEELLYQLFGVNAELLIDHSWGWEPATIQSVKSYEPRENSMSSGQVLHCAYNFEDAKTIVKNMANGLSNDLVRKNLITNKIVLDIHYDTSNLTIPALRNYYKGEIKIDHYGRKVPKPAHGTINLEHKTSSAKVIVKNAGILYERIVNKNLLIRKINITADSLAKDSESGKEAYEQMDLFTDYNQKEKEKLKEKAEKQMQNAVLHMQKKYGKNAILRGSDLLKESTTIERNGQIGGHKG